MSTTLRNSFLLIGLAALFCIPILYYSVIQSQVAEAYNGQRSYLDGVISWLYPRFYSEQHRFELAFFLSKTDQLVWRTTAIGLLILMAFYFLSQPSGWSENYKKFWLVQESEYNLRVYAIVCYAAILFYMFDFYWDYQHLYNARSFYKPVLLLKVLHVPLINPSIVSGLCLFFAIACLCCIINYFPFVASCIVLMFFMLFQGWNYSFGKINHGLALLTYVSILMPLQWHYWKKRTSGTAWPVQLIRVTVACCYLMAGLEKLLISGAEWMKSDTFRAYLLEHPTSLGLWVSEHNSLCILLAIAAMVFQLGFILILFKPSLTPWILIIGVLFHWGTVALFGISSYIHPWVVVYVFFIDWQKLRFYLQKRFGANV